MGTIGGNLVNASPAADTIPPLLIHNAWITLEAGDGKRTCRLEDFITAPYQSRIQGNELVTAVELESLEGYREGYERVLKRAAWAISRVSLAWAIQEEEGFYRDVRLAVGSCTPSPFRAGKAETFLKGKAKTREVVSEAAAMAVQEIREISGLRPSFAYKIPVVRAMLEKVLRSH
jgi:CO/xanthine dehydrogenase FAD-binding subunit